MTEPVVCRKGKCKYEKEEFLDECVDCDEAQEIEHDLIKNNVN